MHKKVNMLKLPQEKKKKVVRTALNFGEYIFVREYTYMQTTLSLRCVSVSICIPLNSDKMLPLH